MTDECCKTLHYALELLALVLLFLSRRDAKLRRPGRIARPGKRFGGARRRKAKQ